YEPAYNRISSMIDGTGTTVYSYNPVLSVPTLGAGRLSTIDGPLPNDIIRYSYDSLDRANVRSINGVATSVNFDALGRTVSTTNVLGSFSYSYVAQTPRPSSVILPNRQSTFFDYFDNNGDHLLKEIWNKSQYGNTQSKFDYEYNAQSQITKWTQQASGTPPKVYKLNYDAADQLTSVDQTGNQLPVTIQQYAYRYDSAGNRIMEQTNNNVTLSEYNSLNQLTKQRKADTARHLESLPITGRINFNNTLSYDDNGNTISETSPAVMYSWDVANRLVRITQDSNITEFVYDGLSRRVAEKLNGTVIRRWLWDGTELAEERDADGNLVVKRFFSQGEQINGKNYYFTFDHLGSVREMTDADGQVQTRYGYDPYGRRIKEVGKIDADFGYTGYYYHNTSGLYLALFRIYDANLGRWLSKDPIEESGGLNFYSYVNQNPVNLIDILGLKASCANTCDDEGEEEITDKKVAGYLNEFNEEILGSFEKRLGKTRLGSNGQFYFENKNGNVFQGNKYVKTISLESVGVFHAVEKLELGSYWASQFQDFLEISKGIIKDNGFGCQAKMASGKAIGNLVGTQIGSWLGGAFGFAICGPPCAFIGQAGGGIAGGLFGQWAGKKLAKTFW
ncbi:MAG: Peptidase bacteriocin processing, partial [Segetibacter sp.]|nr:Peptidase bacteriocin processing [Segetibacter sp.]